MENTSPGVPPLYRSCLAQSSELFSTSAASRGCKVNSALASGLTCLLGAPDPKYTSPPVRTAGIKLVLTSPGFGKLWRWGQGHNSIKIKKKEKERGKKRPLRFAPSLAHNFKHFALHLKTSSFRILLRRSRVGEEDKAFVSPVSPTCCTSLFRPAEGHNLRIASRLWALNCYGINSWSSTASSLSFLLASCIHTGEGEEKETRKAKM